MAFLKVGSQTISVARVDRDVEEIGERARAHDGTMRSTVRARKNVWNITTVPLAMATADTLETALTATASYTVRGTLVATTTAASVTCHVEMLSSEYLHRPSDTLNVRRTLRFKLHEQ